MPRPPATLLAASVVEVLEGAVVAGLGTFVGVSTLVGSPGDVGRALALAALTVLGGAGMISVGIGLLRSRRWSRAPATLTQILAMPVGVSMVQSGQLATGVPLLVVGIGAGVLLFAPPTSRALLHPDVTPRR